MIMERNQQPPLDDGWRGLTESARLKPQVGEGLLADLMLGHKGNDPHRSPPLCANQRISLIDLLNQLGPALF